MVECPNFHVFLAHNSVDKPQVKAIANKLRQRGLKPWLDEEQILGGDSIPRKVQEGLNQSPVAAFFIGTTGFGKFQETWELDALIMLCSHKNVRIIPILLPGVDTLPDEPVLFLPRKYLQFRRSVDEIEPLKELVQAIRSTVKLECLFQSLPNRPQLIGRNQDIEHLLDLVNNSHYPIFLEGFGGVGKTVLSIEAAYCCLDRNLFKAIIFIPQPDITLTKIVNVIGTTLKNTLKDENIPSSNPDQQLEKVYEVLTQNPSLLIIDGFKSINKQEQKEQICILNFLRKLKCRQPQSRVVITTRETLTISLELENQFDSIFHQELRCLPQSESIELIKQEADKKEIVLTPEQCQKIYECSFGVPYALIQTIARVKEHLRLHPAWELDEVLDRIFPTNGMAERITEYCVGNSIQELRKTSAPAHKLLLSIAIFLAPAELDAIKCVAGLDDENVVEDGLKRLDGLHLIEVTRTGRYRVLPLIRDYIFTKEFPDYPKFQEAAQKRWVKWYKNYAKKYGGKDWEEWYTKYDYLEREWVVLLSVLNWCKERERYEDIRDLWKYLNDYASIYGYWADRLRWMDWLIEKSVERGEWFTALHCMSSKGWTLVQMWELQKAETLLFDAWKLGQLEDLNVQDSLAKHIVYLYIRKGEYEEALKWLDRWEKEIVEALCSRRQERHKIALQQFNNNTELINNVVQEDDKRIARSRINILYYRGEICFLKNHYEEAQDYFQNVIKEAENCEWGKWTRRINYAQNWLGDIYIKEAQEALIGDELGRAGELIRQAENTLKVGLNEAEINYDKRRSAYYKCSRAKLEKTWGDLENKRLNIHEANNHFKEALKSANSAIEDFARLGIKQEERDIVGIERELEEIRSNLAD